MSGLTGSTPTEKITINLGYVDLGHIDLMVQERFYPSRTDFIRTAIRDVLGRMQSAWAASAASAARRSPSC